MKSPKKEIEEQASKAMINDTAMKETLNPTGLDPKFNQNIYHETDIKL